jgi:predicted metal-dependent hydrolase
MRAPLSPALDEAVALFDAERFFEAHELFELVWKAPDTAEEDRGFWKGVTQVAVGCCHVQRGNAHGAIALLRRATRYLEPRTVSRVDGAALIRLALELAAEVERGGVAAVGSFPRFPPR